jgi:two-component system nitrogen regulation sensor histidine kinase NtrY
VRTAERPAVNSLRARWSLAFALAALLPLAIVMLLLANRIRGAIRADAGERLSATLGMVQLRLRTDRDQIEHKLKLLGRDATLKRLYLVQSGGARDLADYLATQRFLLGLDFLAVTDTASTAIDPGEPPLALIASAAVIYQGQPVGRVRGGLALNQSYLEGLKQTSGVDLVIRDSTGRALATTLPGAEALVVAPGRSRRVTLGGRSYEARSQDLVLEGSARRGFTALVSTAEADRLVGTLQAACAALGLVSVALAIVLGMVWSWQLSRPVERLAAFATRIAGGQWDEPLSLSSVRELEALVRALDRMRRDLQQYRDRLRATERQAAWSQMARQVAHEIKNPLTPIAISVADLKRSYELQRPDFPEILARAARTIDDEVHGLKRLLDEFSALGSLPKPQPARFAVRELFSDLATLYGREVAAGRLRLSPPAGDDGWDADRAQLRQALVNLVKNGIEATAAGGRVEVSARVEGDALELAVADDGPGLDESQKSRLFVPEFTTKEGGSGLGLTMVERIVSDHGGSIQVESEPGRGTIFRLRFPRVREG